MADPMPDARLDEISALADAATPGPWRVKLAHHRKTGQLVMAYFVRPPKPGSNIDNVKSWVLDEIPDAQFIATARTAVPELLAEVRRARAAEAETHRLLDEAATEIEWLVNKLSEHASYEDAEADARDLVGRLRALAAKEA